jgi:NhaA family Na+:H+ antiporter
VSEGRFVQLVQRAIEAVRGGWEQTADRAAKVRTLRRVTRETVSPLEWLEAALHPWVGFGVMPLFALANAGVPLRASSFVDPVALAVAAGLLVGKPLGISLFSAVAVAAGLARLPEGVGWAAVAAGGTLAGIGFTMALFIAGLALEGPALEAAKVGILTASTLAAVAGVRLLAWALPAADRRAR